MLPISWRSGFDSWFRGWRCGFHLVHGSGGGGSGLVVVVLVRAVHAANRSHKVGGPSVVVTGVHLEGGLLVVVALEDLLQGQDAGDGEGDLGDDERLERDGSQRLETDRSGDSEGGQQGGDHVPAAVLLVSGATAGLGARRQVQLDGVRLQELVQLLDQGAVGSAETFQGAGVGEALRDGFVLGGVVFVLGLVLLDQGHSIDQLDGILREERLQDFGMLSNFLTKIEILKLGHLFQTDRMKFNHSNLLYASYKIEKIGGVSLLFETL